MIKKLLQEGFILKTKGFYKHAIEYFYKALEQDNNSSELLLEIADCYFKLKDEERTINYISQILEKEPTHTDSLRLLKKIFENKEAWIEAEQTAKNIYYITKELNDLADIFRLLNQQKKYSEIFEYNIAEDNDNTLYEKAYAKMCLQELNEAEEIINKALNYKQNHKNLLLKGQILYKLNKKSECATLIESLILEENCAEDMNFAGLVAQYKEDFKTALAYFKKAIKIAPFRDDYYYNCASTCFKMNDKTQAKFYYNYAITLAPENQNYHFALANLYYSEKNYKKALGELNYDFCEARILKSIILYDSGYLALAKNEIEKLTQEYPENILIKEYQKKINEELGL